MNKKLKQILTTGVLALAAYNPMNNSAQAETKLNLGFNALETAVITNADNDGNLPVRNRLLTNAEVEIGKLDFGYSGLNEMNNLDVETYFGRHRALVETTDLPIKALADIKTTNEGILDTKYGVRIENPLPIGGTYGHLDLSANHNGQNINLFVGIPLGEGFSFEALQDVTFPTEGKPSYWTELQLNKTLFDKVSAFGRMEMPDFDTENATYMFGLTYQF